MEGQARYMEDKVYDDLDQRMSEPSFLSEVNDGPLSSAGSSLLNLDYGACLFWSYLGEQFFADGVEPSRGIRAVSRFWNNASDQIASGTVSSCDALDAAISDYRNGNIMEDMWRDYSVANVMKDYDVSELPEPDRWDYDDDDQFNPDGDYDEISASASVLSFGPAGVDFEFASPFSNRYFQVQDLSTVGTCEAVGIKAVADEVMDWSAVASQSNPRVAKYISQGRGKEFVATFLMGSDPAEQFDELWLMPAGQRQTSEYTITVASGPISLNIEKPTTNVPARPGPADSPENFLIHVLVEGPDELSPDSAGPKSVLGLSASDFEVTVGDRQAGVVQAAILGGEYVLLVKAPVQPDGDGLYDMRVSVCGGIDHVETGGVKYDDRRFNHMIVLDASGSMNQPSINPKIEAARIAAHLYTNSIRSVDRIGAVTFNGDGIDCNDDSLVSLILDADEPHRNYVESFLFGTVPSGRTALGDGLVKAQLFLNLFGDPDYEDVIVLLSDGLVNEEKNWDAGSSCTDAKTSLTGSDIKIYPVGFLPEADELMLMDIAEFTGGVYDGVDVSAGSGPAAAFASSTSMPQLRSESDSDRDSYEQSIANRPSGDSEYLSSDGSHDAGPNSVSNVDDGLSDSAAVEPGGIVSYGVFPGNPIALELAEVFMNILQEQGGLQRPFTTKGEAIISTVVDIPVTEVFNDAIMYFNIDHEDGGLAVSLRDPDGNVVSPSVVDVHSSPSGTVYHFNESPALGTWQAELTASTVIYSYMAGMMGKPVSGAALVVKTAQLKTGGTGVEPATESNESGVPVQVLGLLSDEYGAIKDAQIEVDVIMPNDEEDCGAQAMRDDGSSADGQPHDGVYGLMLTNTWRGSSGGFDNDGEQEPPPGLQHGSYIVRVRATGIDNSGQEFERLARVAFHVFDSGVDSDNDSLPDTWEVFYGSNPTVANAGQDSDSDGLSNIVEMHNGTDPDHVDSDNDGEPDGSERNHGRCPTGSTGFLRSPIDVEAISENGDESPIEIRDDAVMLRFPWRSSYARMKIYRGIDQSGSMSLLTEVVPNDEAPLPTNYLDDDGISPGHTYYYQFQAVAADGGVTRRSRVVSRTIEVPSPYTFVNPDANGANDGSSWENAFEHLQRALEAAEAGDEIWVVGGVHKPNFDTESSQFLPGNRSAAFALVDGVSIYGGFAGNETERDQRDPVRHPTILSGDLHGDDEVTGNRSDNSYHVVTAQDDPGETAKLDGFMIRGGQADGSLYNRRRGGGVWIRDADPRIVNCIIEDNHAMILGGGALAQFSNASFEDCVFRNNTAESGGGLGLLSSFATVSECEFDDNSALLTGGGIMATGGGLSVIDRCRLQENRSGRDGGGILINSAQLNVINTLVSRNRAERDGAGISHNNSNWLGVYNCTVAHNVAERFAGGIDVNANPNQPVEIANTIVWGNIDMGPLDVVDSISIEPVDFKSIYVESLPPNTISLDSPTALASYDTASAADSLQIRLQNGDLSVDYCDVQGGYSGSGNISIHPGFVGATDYRLLTGSPCIDAADNSRLPPGNQVDLASQPRFMDDPLTADTGVADDRMPNIDMGAYEYQP
jgi:hypothetical protein